MKRIQLISMIAAILLLVACPLSNSDPKDPTNPANPWLQSNNTIEEINAYYLGHSLISGINDMAMYILNEEQPGSFDFDEQEIPGCPLSYHWDSTESGPGEFVSNPDIHMVQLHAALDSGNYNHIVVTDSVPRGGAGMEAETVDYLELILARARLARPDVRLYYYETWHHRDSGTQERIDDPEEQATGPNSNRELAWLPRLEADAVMWQRIVDTVNSNDSPATGEYPVKLIPAGRILGTIVEAAENGELPGVNGIEDIFGMTPVYNDEGTQLFDGEGNPLAEPDFIHLSHIGSYAISCIHAAVLSLRDPVGYTADVYDIHGGSFWDTPNWWGYEYPAPDPATVTAIQQMVRDRLQDLYIP